MLVRTKPIRTASDFLEAFDARHAFRFDTSAVTDEQELESAAVIADWIADMNEVWDECYMSQRLDYARSFVELCEAMEQYGYLCHLGHHRQRLREKSKPDLVFSVGLMLIQPKSGGDGERFALVQLEGGWETMEEDLAKF